MTNMATCTQSIERNHQHPSNLWAYEPTLPTPHLRRLTMLLLNVKNTPLK